MCIFFEDIWHTSEFVFARCRLIVIRHLTAVFDCKLQSFESSANSEDFSFTDSSIYASDLPSTPKFSTTFFGFVRSREPRFIWNGDTMYFRFRPRTNLSRSFTVDEFCACLGIFSFIDLSFPSFSIIGSQRTDSFWIGMSWRIIEDVEVLEEMSVFVLDATEMSSANNNSLRGKFDGFLGGFLNSFQFRWRALNLFGIPCFQTGDFVWQSKLKRVFYKL